MINFIKKHAQALTAIIFTVIGLYWRYKALAQRELWTDELYQLHNALGSFKPIWQRIPLGELTCFPGEYLITYPFVRFFGPDKWLINIPHILLTAIGFYLLYLICRKNFQTLVGTAIAFLVVCFNGNLIFHAFEFRPYAVLPTLALATFFLTQKLIQNNATLSRWTKIWIGGFFVVVIIYHANGILLTGVCWLYFLIRETKEHTRILRIKESLPFFIKVLFVAAPLFIWYSSGTVANWAHTQSRNINTFDVYPNPLTNINDFFELVFANLMGNKKYGQKLLFYGIWISFLLPHKDRLAQIGFFLVLIILPIELILITELSCGYWFLDRQFIWVMPFYALLLGWSWESIFLYVKEKVAKKRTRQ